MNKITILIFVLIITVLNIIGCNKSKSFHNDLDIEQLEPKNNEIKEITANLNLKTSEELIKIIESEPNKNILMSTQERGNLKDELYLNYTCETTASAMSDISSTYMMLSSIVANNKYEELFDKNNQRWDIYDDNNLFGISVCMDSASLDLNNEKLKNDLNRVKELCDYGLKSRDIISIIDAYRIISDIDNYIINTQNNNNKYYGSTEILEGNEYNLIGIYKYN
ncbi:MAG: hypothetical protein IJ086_04180 [Clostridium sp.]|nr:hypothetical protein [Clostridium sp.]